MSMYDKPDEYHVLVKVTPSNGGIDHYLHPSAFVCAINNDNKFGDLRYPGWSWRANGFDEYADLEYTGQMSLTNGRCDHPDFYAQRAAYKQVYSTELNQAEAIVKVLRKIDRTFTKASERYGSVDYAGMVRRFADAVGADKIGVHQHGACFPATGSHYKFVDVDGLRYWLNQQISEWKAAHGVVDKAA